MVIGSVDICIRCVWEGNMHWKRENFWYYILITSHIRIVLYRSGMSLRIFHELTKRLWGVRTEPGFKHILMASSTLDLAFSPNRWWEGSTMSREKKKKKKCSSWEPVWYSCLWLEGKKKKKSLVPVRVHQLCNLCPLLDLGPQVWRLSYLTPNLKGLEECAYPPPLRLTEIMYMTVSGAW